MKKLLISTNDEDIEGQIDRLNIAVQKLMVGIEISAQTPRNPSRLSFAHPDWMDDEDLEKSVDETLPETFEQKFEEILIQLDRVQMQNEDFWSDQFRKEQNLSEFINEEYVLKLEKENMELRAKSMPSKIGSSLTLKKSNESLEAEKKNFEEKLLELDKLNESYRQKHVQVLKIQESLRVRERWIDQKDKELKTQWQKFEKTKQEWEKSKSLCEGQYRDMKHNRLALSYDKSLLNEKNLKPEAPPPETPISRDQALKNMQGELMEAEKLLEDNECKEDKQKLVMKIDSLKNKIATLRGQKALFESNRSSRLISTMMRTMEKEVNYEEHKRKAQLERFTNKKNPNRDSIDLTKVQIENLKKPLKVEAVEEKALNTQKNGIGRIMEDRQVLDFRKHLLEKREQEVHVRELMLQETWMKLPNSKDLIETVNLALSKLTAQKRELDDERLLFEQEKIEMLKIRDKLKTQVDKISSHN